VLLGAVPINFERPGQMFFVISGVSALMPIIK